MTALAGALHLCRRPGPRAGLRSAAPAPVPFKDLGVLPVCGGSVRPAASQRALADRRGGQP